MAKRLKTKDELLLLIATASSPRPGDFPVGSLMSRAAARAMIDSCDVGMAEWAELGELTPVEEAWIEGYPDAPLRVRVRMIWYRRMAAETRQAFGMPPWPETAESIRHERKVQEAIHVLAGGKKLDAEQLNRCQEIAEERLKTGEAIEPLDWPDPDANSPLSQWRTGHPQSGKDEP